MSAVVNEQMISFIPNQSAVRIIVPIFPGSCIVSSASIICEEDDSSLIDFASGFANTAKTGEGVLSVDIFLISSAESTIIVSVFLMKLCFSVVKLSIHFCSATKYLHSKWLNRSVTSLSPSAVYKFKVSLNFL